VIDSHTHLHACKPDDADLVAAADAAGVTRMLTVGTTGATCREALLAAERFPQVYAAIGRHPNEATGFDDADLAELQALAEHPRCAAIGETGLDFYRDYAPRADQQRAFEAQIELARATAKPLVIHTRDATEETIDTLRTQAGGVEVILHCFTMADRLDECLEQGWWISFAGNVTYPSAPQLAAAAERVPDDRLDECAEQGWWFSFAGNVTYPKAQELARAAERVPADRLLVETDAPYLTPQPVRKERNQPAFVVHTARFVAQRRGLRYEELQALVQRNAAGLFGW